MWDVVILFASIASIITGVVVAYLVLTGQW